MFSVFFLIASQIADLASTLYGFNHGLVEVNPHFQDLTAAELSVVKYLVCLIAILVWLLVRRTRWNPFFQAAFLISGAYTFGVAIHNFSLVT
jgi:urea transporter